MVKGYPEFYEQVSSLMNQFGAESPDTMAGFIQLHKAGSKDGALSGKVKELIALGIAICVRCDGCIAFHVQNRTFFRKSQLQCYGSPFLRKWIGETYRRRA